MDPHVIRACSAFMRSDPDRPAPTGGHLATAPDGRRYAVVTGPDGVMAVYRIKPDDFLKRSRRWPTTVETPPAPDVTP